MMLTPRPMRGAITIKYTEINNFDKVGALNEERGRRQVTIEILKSIARHGQVFTLEQLHRQTGTPKSVLSVMLSRWEDRGFVERIERGKYLIIPLASEKGKYTLHEFVIASHLVRPSAIAYWSALHYHGLTEQIPMTVFVQTTARKKNNQLEVFGVDYRIVRVKPEKFFGFAKEWIEETQVTVTDREKTLDRLPRQTRIRGRDRRGCKGAGERIAGPRDPEPVRPDDREQRCCPEARLSERAYGNSTGSAAPDIQELPPPRSYDAAPGRERSEVAAGHQH
ncbi:type IV toxin-antitoxin system AbiEi family antitoxin domain-containing protein [Methanoculleus sp. UBA389]|uniref:type IV toxin-antitoxin system AbiEi family antitoxin domain-containing protein n=1 Tax=Methanoculleus sp. UBA389 TaxID=1915507 RepID=UPI0031BAC8DC